MKKIINIVILSLCVGHLFAVPAQINARFKQERTLVLMQQKDIKTGSFSFISPNKITWKYDDGITAQLPPQMLTFIKKAVTGEFNSAEFSVEKDGDYTILTPQKKQLKQLFKQIKILIDTKTEVAKEVTLYETSGDVTLIEFYDIGEN